MFNLYSQGQFNCDVLKMANTTVATFVDNTTLIAVGSSIAESTNKLQQVVSRILSESINEELD